MVAFLLFRERLESAAMICYHVAGMRRAQQLALWPAESRAVLAAHAATAAELCCGTAAAAALQQQVGMATEFATVQACHIP
jgi:hypothetical protein